MTVDAPKGDLEEVARRFSHLWHALTSGEKGAHSDDLRAMLVDRVRDALDRGADKLDSSDKNIIANTFVLEALVHRGVATDVFRTRHRDLGTFHAIKMLRADHAHDPVARKLLLREAQIGMALCHPHLAATQAVLRLSDGRPALVTEWLDCRIAGLLPGSLSIKDVTTIMVALLSAIAAVHAVGFVHCDLSPSNLLYGDGFRDIKIVDFGIALEIGRRHSELDIAFAGQPDFASPEQMAGEIVDARSDLYAAGLLLSLLLRHCRETGEKAEELKTLAIRLSQRRPQDRPENAKAALHLLGGLNGSE
ncbi:serine/threonine-protein kinase [Neorhizobium alkalisoli]|uniref:serine/threonine-protein kinase n=1 Tax=Neorhizobium alkalisoli TaxID=528178 RepID=UPI000CF90A37|nr:serine/threonine-protein kinase [Neorhizobium alkalisoli]